MEVWRLGSWDSPQGGLQRGSRASRRRRGEQHREGGQQLLLQLLSGGCLGHLITDTWSLLEGECAAGVAGALWVDCIWQCV